jgi:hypothetical protein
MVSRGCSSSSLLAREAAPPANPETKSKNGEGGDAASAAAASAAAICVDVDAIGLAVLLPSSRSTAAAALPGPSGFPSSGAVAAAAVAADDAPAWLLLLLLLLPPRTARPNASADPARSASRRSKDASCRARGRTGLAAVEGCSPSVGAAARIVVVVRWEEEERGSDRARKAAAGCAAWMIEEVHITSSPSTCRRLCPCRAAILPV